jgi:hypothetical protein
MHRLAVRNGPAQAQKALPDCHIYWDQPANKATSEPDSHFSDTPKRLKHV